MLPDRGRRTLDPGATATEITGFYRRRNFETSRRFQAHQYSPEPLRFALQALGNPQYRIPAIRIIGTLGKGSLAVYLSRMYRELGFTVGLYTSPHYLIPEERIQTGGYAITDEELRWCWDRLREKTDPATLSFFDAMTAMAFLHFERSGVARMIIETGLGGRLDSTNNLLPMATVFTPIDLDHQDILGATIREIAMEKARVETGKGRIITCNQHPKAHTVLKSFHKSRLHRLLPKGSDYTKWNLDYARKVFRLVEGIRAPEVPTGLPGHLEVLFEKESAGTLLFDAAHNLRSVERLALDLRKIAGRREVLLAINTFRERDAAGFIATFRKYHPDCRVVLVAHDDPLMHAELPGIDITNTEEIVSLLMNSQVCVVVCGSIHLYRLALDLQEKLKGLDTVNTEMTVKR